MNLDVNVILNIILFSGIIAAAAIYITSQTRKENHAETKELADTRGEKIDDLQDEIDKMKQRMLKQDGKIELLLSAKFNELAVNTATQVLIELHRLQGNG